MNPSKVISSRASSWSRLFSWVRRGLLVLVAGLLALIVSGAIFQTVATWNDERANPPPGQRVDIGGYRLHMRCTGPAQAGSPTVILEQGLGGTSAGWARVQPGVAQAARVCAYDRAGMGWSDPGPQPRDAAHIVAELHTLLTQAQVPGPYVLVGWSYGGLYVRAYAAAYPSDVAGVVLLDSSHPDQWTGTPEGQAAYQQYAGQYVVSPWLARLGLFRLMSLSQAALDLPSPQREQLSAFGAAAKDWDEQSAEFLASAATCAAARAAGPLGNRPLVVLSATDHGLPTASELAWQAWQNELAALSTNSLHHVIKGAQHASFWLDPAVAHASAAAIIQVVNAVRNGTSINSK